MIRRILKYILIVFGCLFLILFIFCFTSGAFWAWYKMGTKYAGVHRPPEVIVILGGGGMPSESGLMRCWYGAKAANYFYRAKVVVALPGDTTDSLSSVSQMKKELVLRGVDARRISFEAVGTDTRAQAMNQVRSVKCQVQKESQRNQVRNVKCEMRGKGCSILIITSPEHLYRAVLTFRKAGFARVDGMPAFETTIESELAFDDRLLGGKIWMPSIGNNITLRYQFWTQLRYEQLIIREWLAIGYYWLNGWI
jgi:uncharacterized SAM-binding protein YcdF (DUF218 family)